MVVGLTDLVITLERRVLVAAGLLTVFHEPEAYHLAVPAAMAG